VVESSVEWNDGTVSAPHSFCITCSVLNLWHLNKPLSSLCIEGVLKSGLGICFDQGVIKWWLFEVT
jgi:hypothetical protein